MAHLAWCRQLSGLPGHRTCAYPSVFGFVFAIVEATNAVLRVVVVMILDEAESTVNVSRSLQSIK